ncbi:MAG: glycosyltransferase [Lachnospiraceae bacterium]|nr:glycosyltransferase [Lachnospiraceae bacterium]
MNCSVAMATYNGAPYIEKQLKSILEQSIPVNEVVISDDGSSDGTLGIVETFISDNNLGESWRLIRNEDHGVRGNFYNAIRNCSGDIVFLCDQDDIWRNQKVQEVCKFFDEYPSALCVDTSFIFIDEDGNRIDKTYPKKTANNGLILHEIGGGTEQIPLKLVINKNISPGMTMAVRKKAINRWLDCTEKRCLHDWEINCVAASMSGLFFLNKELVYYRIHSSQTVSIGNIKKRTKREILLEKIRNEKASIDAQLGMVELAKKTGGNVQYLSRLERLLNTRAMVRQGNANCVLKEIGLYLCMVIRYGGRTKNIDIRYLFIDIISTLV